jgi:hypothetical protein
VSRLKVRRPSPALLVAIIAVFVALGGGGALAASKLIVHTDDIANGAVTGRKLAAGAVGLKKLNTPLRAAIAKAGARGVVGQQGPTGPQGTQGPQGPPGPQGSTGATGATGAKGDAGPQGAQGQQGQAGAQGQQGQPGAQGDPGSTGDKGDKGDKGDQGPQGNPGPTGPKGDAGPAGPQGPQGDPGPVGPSGPAGKDGTDGTDGKDGADGLNPAVAVDHMPSIASSSGTNPNPDSGDAGDGGWYFTGDGAGGSASLTDGALELTGSGVDANTTQGGIGVAKAFTNMKLSDLNALSYDWTVDTANGDQAPCVHITVGGLTADSHFASGFANLVLNPFLNGQNAVAGAQFHTDGFTAAAKWYSTTEPGPNSLTNPGSQDDPQPMSFFTGKAADSGATIGQISLDNCGTTGGSGNFDAVADGLLINSTRYDFGG